MPRYVAFLRGVSPTNAKMAELRRSFEAAGFADVTTVLGSGNVVFNSRSASESSLEHKAEKAMQQNLGRTFLTIVRPAEFLQHLIQTDPYAQFGLSHPAKRVVTFLREPSAKALRLPIEADGARILANDGREVFSAYAPSPKGPVFMVLIEKTFGKNVTTRTWETVEKCAKA